VLVRGQHGPSLPAPPICTPPCMVPTLEAMRQSKSFMRSSGPSFLIWCPQFMPVSFFCPLRGFRYWEPGTSRAGLGPGMAAHQDAEQRQALEEEWDAIRPPPPPGGPQRPWGRFSDLLKAGCYFTVGKEVPFHPI